MGALQEIQGEGWQFSGARGNPFKKNAQGQASEAGTDPGPRRAGSPLPAMPMPILL